jgi:hypothetical protein
MIKEAEATFQGLGVKVLSTLVQSTIQTSILVWPPFFYSLVTLPKHVSINQPTGLENHVFTFINVSELYIFFIFGRLPHQQEQDAVAGCATVCVQYGYAYCTVWRWTTTDKNTQPINII